MPSLVKVREVVGRYLAALPDHRSGDILSRAEVEPLFRQLKILGWTVRDQKGILKRVPADGEFLVRQLRTTPGRKFMRKVSGYRLVYDRMDRTIKLPGGRQLIHDIIRLPDGYRYLQVKPTPGFKNLAELLPKNASGKSPKGKDYNKPTGRIYTGKTLLEALEESYARSRRQIEGNALRDGSR